MTKAKQLVSSRIQHGDKEPREKEVVMLQGVTAGRLQIVERNPITDLSSWFLSTFQNAGAQLPH